MIFLIILFALCVFSAFFATIIGDKNSKTQDKKQNFYGSDCFQDDFSQDSERDFEKSYDDYYRQLYDCAAAGDKDAIEEMKDEFGDSWESEF